MKRDKYTGRTDTNQKDIVATLREMGCSVTPTHAIGKGFPDLTIGYKGKNILMEVKMMGKGLNAKETYWFDNWNGQAAIAYTPEQAIEIVKELTE